MLAWRESVGKVLKPLLESTALDKVKYVPVVRRFAADWAVALGLWDDGVLAKDEKHAPIDVAAAAAWTKARRAGAASLTLYVDSSDEATARVQALLDDAGVAYRTIDISDDDASRKWLADTCDGARPPQLFRDGVRLGGLEHLRKLREEGKLLSAITSVEAAS